MIYLPDKDVPAVVYPPDNGEDPDRWELGKRLFYETALSVDSSISCASCHKQEFAFADHQAFSPGAFGRAGVRNAPSLANVGLHPYLTREGGVPTLEMQVLVPIQEHNEFGFNIVDICKRLAEDQTYQAMSQKAYGRSLDEYVLTRALANFERSITSNSSAFDRYFYQNEVTALSSDQIKGMQLFYSDRAKCGACHSGYDLTNYMFENNGLYLAYPDSGRYRLTERPEDVALFKVPSLRNIALTAPYMHDGSITSLEDVLEHYSQGVQEHANKNTLLKPLHLSQEEKQQLVAFLESLTDYKLINNNIYKDE